MKVDVVIVGAGLFGSMTARLLENMGYETVVIDAGEPMAASKCSFGVWKEGWINPIIRAEVDHGRGLLENIGGIEEVEFANLKNGKYEVFQRTDCSKILLQKKEANLIPCKVSSMRAKEVLYDDDRLVVTAKKAVIVAAGVWTSQVLGLMNGLKNVPQVDSLWGATLDVGLKVEENRVLEWAPYKQCVLVRNKTGNAFSFGDGCTVKNPKKGDPRIEKASNRILTNLYNIVGTRVSNDKITDVKEGYRPYLKKGSPNFINQHAPWLFSATGGAKNSTILCGHIALKLYEKIKDLK